jgi:Cu2+-exporting ATPase
MRFDRVREIAGCGLEASASSSEYRLGRPDWAAAGRTLAEHAAVACTKDGQLLAVFRLEDRLRQDTPAVIRSLRGQGLAIEILSGDADQAVEKVAKTLRLPYRSRVSPAGKVDHLSTYAVGDRKLLMVGDGLNDAPALAAAHVSMAPASAADVGRNAADLVFLRESLMAVPQAIAVARQASRLVRQNVVLAAAYNLVAVPIAIAGEVTPLIAAVAMSLSSVLVVTNSLRLGAAGPLKGNSRRESPAPIMAADRSIA